ncbi:MAG: hypothetical protein IE928_10975 [Gammaproteobacteria bacterium]|nr:hypothetical protein [Gammaproteobacteria bacterium]
MRAYPQGEASGDHALLGQIEVRYQYQDFTPYAFYDLGKTTTNASTWTVGDNEHAIAGGGIGIRANYQNWNADVSLAWRTTDEAPQSDTRDDTPRVWSNISYRF